MKYSIKHKHSNKNSQTHNAHPHAYTNLSEPQKTCVKKRVKYENVSLTKYML